MALSSKLLEKNVINQFTSNLFKKEMIIEEARAQPAQRSMIILTHVLSSFSNFASISDVNSFILQHVKTCLRALHSRTLASLMMITIAGTLF